MKAIGRHRRAQRAAHAYPTESLKDFTEKNRIAVPTLKVSLQAIYLQMALDKEFGDFKKFDFIMVQMGDQATIALADDNDVLTATSPACLHADGAEEPTLLGAAFLLDVIGEQTNLLAYTTANSTTPTRSWWSCSSPR